MKRIKLTKLTWSECCQTHLPSWFKSDRPIHQFLGRQNLDIFCCVWFGIRSISQPENTQIIKLKAPYAREFCRKSSQASEEVHLVETLR